VQRRAAQRVRRIQPRLQLVQRVSLKLIDSRVFSSSRSPRSSSSWSNGPTNPLRNAGIRKKWVVVVPESVPFIARWGRTFPSARWPPIGHDRTITMPSYTLTGRGMGGSPCIPNLSGSPYRIGLKTEADAATSLKPAGDVGRSRAQGRQRPLPQIIDGATDRGGRDADGADGMPIGIEDRHRENA
jgi:hypothetical protein